MQASIRAVLVVAIFGMQLIAEAPAVACPPANSASVHSGNTIDIHYFPGSFESGHTYTLGVKASGTGTNKLTIKVEVPRSGPFGGWKSIATKKIDLANTGGCGYAEVQFTIASASPVRYRFSRKIGTSEIDYDWDHDFTDLWGGQSSRCLMC